MTTETKRALEDVVRDARLCADGPSQSLGDVYRAECLVREAHALGIAEGRAGAGVDLREALDALWMVIDGYDESGQHYIPSGASRRAREVLITLRSPPPEDSGRLRAEVERLKGLCPHAQDGACLDWQNLAERRQVEIGRLTRERDDWEQMCSDNAGRANEAESEVIRQRAAVGRANGERDYALAEVARLRAGAASSEARGFAAGIEAMRGETIRMLRRSGTTTIDDLARRVEDLRWDHPLPGLRAPSLRAPSPATSPDERRSPSSGTDSGGGK